jgi:hypothetical protein
LFHMPYYSRRIPMEWFWEKTESLDLPDRTVLTFSPTAQFLHLASHLVLGHQDNGLRWLYDIALLLRRYGERIDWKELADAATAFELRPVLQMALKDVAQVWNVALLPTEETTMVRLKPSLGERWVVAVNTARHVDAGEVWNVASLGGWRKRLGYLGQTLFPGSKYMQERYGITNARLVPAYYLWRLGKGFYMLLRSGFSIGLNLIKHPSNSKQTR